VKVHEFLLIRALLNGGLTPCLPFRGKINPFNGNATDESDRYNNWLFLGRKYNYPIALEGAPKLKEISYIHAEGYAAGEMKHGRIALISPDMPTVAIVPKDDMYEKMTSNIHEIRSRKGPVIAIATEGDNKIKDIVDDVIEIPASFDFLNPVLAVIPCQLLAYYSANFLNRDVDKPRDLAKNVTVE
jgi:glucosamine--fructose-6-phosphate aminotransferase (isomerizing)